MTQTAAPLQPVVYRISVPEYRRLAFIGTAPSCSTIRRWLEKGELPGEKRGGTWMVFVDAQGQPLRTRSRPATGNAEADALLQQWESTR